MDPFGAEDLPGFRNESDGFGLRTFLPFDLVVVMQRSGIAVGAILILWLLLLIVWTWNLRGLTAIEKAYTRMGRLGAIAGVTRRPNQTALDYAAALGEATADVRGPAHRIAWAYSGLRYSPRPPPESEHDVEAPELGPGDIEGDWRQIRGPLLSRAIRRLMPGGMRTE